VRELIRQLSRNLETALAPRSITLDVACSDFSLPNSAAVSLGIIVNELVTNAAIHAFDSQKTPNISLCVNGENGGALTLRVADNGVGVPGSVLRGEGYGYGLSIIDTLVEQLGGSWHLENDEGTRVTVSLPVVAGVVSPPARLAEAPLR
jgi:two-component sensor histidine kinase